MAYGHIQAKLAQVSGGGVVVAGVVVTNVQHLTLSAGVHVVPEQRIVSAECFRLYGESHEKDLQVASQHNSLLATTPAAGLTLLT